MGIIYQATNVKNNKSYIGQTKFTLEERKLTHEHDSKRTTCYFHKALQKDGVNSFRWETLFECENEFLNFIEKFFIRSFNTFQDGYNLTTGGDGGYVRSNRTKKLISIAAKKRTGKKNPFFGKKHSEKTKKELSKKCKENANPVSFWKGKKLSEEHKQNIGISQMGEKSSVRTKTFRRNKKENE